MKGHGIMNRRTFLKSAAAVGMGGLFLGSTRGMINASPQKAPGKVWTMKYDCYIVATAPTAQLDLSLIHISEPTRPY